MRHLLLVGRDLKALLPHSFELGNHFSTTTLAVAEDVLARAAIGAREGYEAIVVFLSNREDARSRRLEGTNRLAAEGVEGGLRFGLANEGPA